MMIRALSNKGTNHKNHIISLLKGNKVGGLCFFQGGPLRQANLVNEYRAVAPIPLLISMDAEYGLAMRLDSTYRFPYAITLGAMDEDNDSLVLEMGKIIGKQLNMVGVNINFAPVLDINNNPDNPVINSRSFGEDKYKVARFGMAYAQGLQSENIIATGKHFPGHGDTDSDSHKTLPVITHSRERLDTLELYPFRQAIKAGIEGIMVAHLSVPALGTPPNTPATLSKSVVQGLLKDELGFQGLAITDALEMKGVTKYFPSGEAAVKALEAGNDILLLPENLNQAVSAIEKAVKQKRISEKTLEEKVKKILHYKYKYALPRQKRLATENLYQTLNNEKNISLSREIFKRAITLVKNTGNLIPVNDTGNQKIASFCTGDAQRNTFQQILSKYGKIDHFNSFKGIENKKSLLKKLAEYDIVIAAFHNSSIFPQRNFGLNENDIALMDSLAKKTKVILTLFASPYSLNLLPDSNHFTAIVVAYEDRDEAQSIAAQIITGGLPAKGHLPVSVKNYPSGTGIQTTSLHKLKYGTPVEVGVSEEALKKIDSLVYANIEDKTMPGCQILFARNGTVFFEKAYGYHTYEKKREVRLDDIYDLASLTKIFATTAAVMKLNQEGKLDIDRKLSGYVPYLQHSNKKDMIIREVMAHQARLKPWIPFYLDVVDSNRMPKPDIIKDHMEPGFSKQIAKDMFIADDYTFQIYREIADSKLRKRKKYKYSDLGFYLLKQAVENVTGEPFEEYAGTTFYKPLGMDHTFFNPSRYYPLKDIIPTEKDDYFRHQTVRGYVHDPGAAMLGGVSGHAGLFSNANDLAKMAQMFLQKGFYGGRQYIDSVWISDFTRTQFPLNENRRGIGFDKPEEERDEGPSCEKSSDKSFGHSGFTGTYFWVDPEYDLIYVFLSNRTYPSATNRKLITNNVRTNIMEIILEDLDENREK